MRSLSLPYIGSRIRNGRFTQGNPIIRADLEAKMVTYESFRRPQSRQATYRTPKRAKSADGAGRDLLQCFVLLLLLAAVVATRVCFSLLG